MLTSKEPNSSVWRLANAAFDGQLAERLGSLRAAGMSWQEMAMELYADRRVRLSHESLRKWAIRLGVVNPDGTPLADTSTPEPAAS